MFIKRDPIGRIGLDYISTMMMSYSTAASTVQGNDFLINAGLQPLRNKAILPKKLGGQVKCFSWVTVNKHNSD
ncbi:hypothetical protein SAMN05216387_102391 [Nitrosovibrio tenuis]|uniref:Uncharacterized protein n=1 Tax=Nitrosovibrio tenuis TaxID=1233 RepID=A0A1H7J4Q5_9PROT|nr:hypothetical protein SAMN05216387_102391 [Nitrosovibrio tenuis]